MQSPRGRGVQQVEQHSCQVRGKVKRMLLMEAVLERRREAGGEFTELKQGKDKGVCAM